MLSALSPAQNDAQRTANFQSLSRINERAKKSRMISSGQKKKKKIRLLSEVKENIGISLSQRMACKIHSEYEKVMLVIISHYTQRDTIGGTIHENCSSTVLVAKEIE